MSRYALIIDDNPSNLEALALLLKKEGVLPITIQTIQDLSTGLDSASKFDVVFLDLEFPNHSGFDLVKTLKKDPRLHNTPIVAYSVHTSELNEARAAGFDSFVGKPLIVDKFPGQLRRILQGHAVWEVGA